MNIPTLATRVGKYLADQRLVLVTAESCTGGWIAQAITDVAGSSMWFDRGFVTYSNLSKQEMLGVGEAALQRYGAVSEAVAREMAMGALTHSAAQVGVAVSGIAGPGGGTADKPVGTVCFAWAINTGDGKGAVVKATTGCFAGDREAIRRQAVVEALQGVERMLLA
ncbi:MAG: nicotinamide-nucleotide amidohydrolase family protein [Gammaproteobacteria bacterium]|nr:nicotinamide-nucleotide amidohydrolase family protein [Gammaproteobacteria bacterium]NNJ84104.1 nicotinamide-nucleotide amidohydrolase family protein [Gammaproteobacteria bacterium]